jgi:hypothetical protein
VTDAVFADGNPGMGFYLQGMSGVNADYGFTCYSAASGSVAPPCAAPAPTAQTGWMTGNGRVVTPSGLVTIAFELHCKASDGDNSLDVNGGGNKFRLEHLTSAMCVDAATIDAGRPHAGFDTLHGKGTGRYNGAPATAEWTFTDAGEPGRNDTDTIQIKNSSNVIVLTASGRLVTGNNQAHKQRDGRDGDDRDDERKRDNDDRKDRDRDDRHERR